VKTAISKSNANLALLKYWGVDDTGKVLLPSLSVPLPDCVTETKVTLVVDATVREVKFDAAPTRIIAFVDQFLAEFNVKKVYIVETSNNFPVAVGMASSASGFSALAKALAELVGVDVLDDRVKDLLARTSGSALRSLLDGVVEWQPSGHELVVRDDLAGFDLEVTSYIVDDCAKEFSSSELHKMVPSSPLFADRLANFADRYERLVTAMRNDDWPGFADVVTEEAWSFLIQAWSCKHKVALLKPESLQIWEKVVQMRADGVDICVTFDAGATVHVLGRKGWVLG